MIVKKTCRNRFTAFISTARRYSHASPDIIAARSALAFCYATRRLGVGTAAVVVDPALLKAKQCYLCAVCKGHVLGLLRS